MSILKALEKQRAEGASGVRPIRVTPPANENVVLFSRETRPANQPPELLVTPIGSQSSAFMGQPDPATGTALPGQGSGLTAGAKLNAEALTRSAETGLLPDFIRWTVDAERVEPRLVAITQPNSAYCEEYRSLRTHVLHKSQRQKLQSIVVASINPSE